MRTILSQRSDDQNAYYQKYVRLEREESDMGQEEVKYQVSVRSWSVSQTVVETEVDEKMSHKRRVNSCSVITIQISDFPSFIFTLFIAAAFLSENKIIS